VYCHRFSTSTCDIGNANTVEKARDKIIDKIKHDRKILTGDLETKINEFIKDGAEKYMKETKEKMRANILNKVMKGGMDKEQALIVMDSSEVKK